MAVISMSAENVHGLLKQRAVSVRPSILEQESWEIYRSEFAGTSSHVSMYPTHDSVKCDMTAESCRSDGPWHFFAS